MDNASSDFRAKELGKLVIADVSFSQILALCHHMLEHHFKATDPLFPPQMCGLVVTYAKNFVSGTNFGPLPERFRKFNDETFAETHERLIEARHTIYAHRDAEAASNMEFDELGHVVPYQVSVEWSPTFIAYPVTPELSPDIIPFIARLVKFQSERICARISELGRDMVVNGKKYRPYHRYTLGVDFP
jgi:hypothetical protein